jgi:hypothetical protein
LEYISETNEIVIRKDDYLRLGPNGFYKYIGQVKTIHEVPNSNCLYSMDGLLYIRRVDLERLNRMKDIEKPAKEVDDSDELDLEVKPGDDSTLIIIKELYKGFTKNAFRKLFDNDSDMNNMRRAIEKSPNGQLSLNRFRVLLNKLGLKYKIYVFEDDMPSANAIRPSNFDDRLEKINSDEKENISSDESNNEEED